MWAMGEYLQQSQTHIRLIKGCIRDPERSILASRYKI